MLAAGFPLLNAFLTILEIVGFLLWIWLAVSVFADIFRSRDLSGGAKAIWTLGVIVFPLVGVLVYLIARGGRMHERAEQNVRAREEAFRHYVRDIAHGDGAGDHTAERLAHLADLRDRGVISQEQYTQEKARITAETTTTHRQGMTRV